MRSLAWELTHIHRPSQLFWPPWRWLPLWPSRDETGTIEGASLQNLLNISFRESPTIALLPQLACNWSRLSYAPNNNQQCILSPALLHGHLPGQNCTADKHMLWIGWTFPQYSVVYWPAELGIIQLHKLLHTLIRLHIHKWGGQRTRAQWQGRMLCWTFTSTLSKERGSNPIAHYSNCDQSQADDVHCPVHVNVRINVGMFT